MKIYLMMVRSMPVIVVYLIQESPERLKKKQLYFDSLNHKQCPECREQTSSRQRGLIL